MTLIEFQPYHTIVSLDMGETHTGFCKAKWQSKLETWEFKTLELPRTKNTYFRPVEVAELIIKELDKIPAFYFLLIEDYAFSRSWYNLVQPEAVGIIKKYIMDDTDCIGMASIGIQTAKKAICGNGNAKKGEVIKSVKQKFPKQEFTSHSADAVALNFALQNYSGDAIKRAWIRKTK